MQPKLVALNVKVPVEIRKEVRLRAVMAGMKIGPMVAQLLTKAFAVDGKEK